MLFCPLKLYLSKKGVDAFISKPSLAALPSPSSLVHSCPPLCLFTPHSQLLIKLQQNYPLSCSLNRFTSSFSLTGLIHLPLKGDCSHLHLTTPCLFSSLSVPSDLYIFPFLLCFPLVHNCHGGKERSFPLNLQHLEESLVHGWCFINACPTHDHSISSQP